MSATAIIVSFVMNTTIAAYCTKPMPLEDAQQQLAKMGSGADWARAHAGFTPPNIILRGHPNYTDAINGKVMDDENGTSQSVPPCKPFP